MADEQKPQEGTETPQGGQLKPEPQEGEERFDAQYVRDLRKEAAGYRARLRELESKLKADEDAKLSEQEKLQKRLKELEQLTESQEKALRAATTEYEVKLAAARLGIVDPEAAWKLLNVSDLEFDESGKPKNLENALKELIKNKPYLAGTVARNAGAGSGSRSPDNAPISMNEAIRRAAGRQ